MLCGAAALALALVPAGAQAQRQPQRQTQPQRQAQPQQQRPPQAQPGQSLPVPDAMSLAKLAWTTMTAVDHANKTGNYSVLRDLGSPSFQAGNNAASLAGIFAGIRQQRVDLSDTLVVQPTFEFPPAMVQPTVLRMRGAFNMRPNIVQFDMLFEWRNGWLLHGIAVRAAPIAGAAPPPTRR